MIEVSLEQAKQFILDAQGLRTTQPSKSVMAVAKRVHNIQIDTISVVARSHNLTTYNRFKKYQDGAIWKEQERGKLFEFWSHAMCLMPMETFPFYAWKRDQYRKLKKSWWVDWGRKNKDIVEDVYKHVKKNGVTMSKSIGERKGKTSGWWDWKVEKRALEYLHTIGRLMVSHRQGFQKCYDLTERVLPPGQDAQPMADEDVPRFMVETLLGSLGLGTYIDAKMYFGRLASSTVWGSKKADYTRSFEEFIEDDLLAEVSIDGQEERYFALKKNVNKMRRVGQSARSSESVSFLTPFDNIARERHRMEDLWNFDYRLESYLPAEKRQYGYFVLPILDHIDFVGRVDAKVHRKEEVIELKALYLETPFWKEADGIERLESGIREFADFHNCSEIKITATTPKSARSILTKKLKQ
jgi:uncharacterized protein YcaQ